MEKHPFKIYPLCESCFTCAFRDREYDFIETGESSSYCTDNPVEKKFIVDPYKKKIFDPYPNISDCPKLRKPFKRGG